LKKTASTLQTWIAAVQVQVAPEVQASALEMLDPHQPIACNMTTTHTSKYIEKTHPHGCDRRTGAEQGPNQYRN
jgi:hypothetical protein